MPRGRPRKIVKPTTDDISQSDIVQSSDDEGRKSSYPKKSHQFNHKNPPIPTSLRTEKPFNPSFPPHVSNGASVPTGKQVSIEQIKRQILQHLPGMNEHVDILDEQMLRDIYETELVQKLQDMKNQDDTKTIIRTPQVLQMIEEIVQSVPTMRQEVEIFSENQIRQLYQEICPSTKGPLANGNHMNGTGTLNGIKPKSIDQIRSFINERVSGMEGEMRSLSDQDLIEVYYDYIEKENAERQRKIPNGYNPNVQQKPPLKPPMPEANKLPFDAFDPMKKFAKQEDSAKAQATDNYRSHSHAEFSNYRNSKDNHPKMSMYPQPSRFSSSLSHEVVSFHNNKRVNALPMDAERLPKTVIIVHTIEPGYLPPPKPKCRCQCCQRREFDLKDPTYIDEFVHTVLLKNGARR